jgi:hypothetical protein
MNSKTKRTDFIEMNYGVCLCEFPGIFNSTVIHKLIQEKFSRVFFKTLASQSTWIRRGKDEN